MAQVKLKLILSTLLAVIGSWQFGFHTGVINAPQKTLKDFIAEIYKTRHKAEIDETLLNGIWSVTVSLFAFAGTFGGLSGGKIANVFGSRTAISFNGILIIVGCLIFAFSKQLKSYETLIVSRLLIGFSCGLYTTLVPMYLSEIANVAHRGAIGTFNQLGVTIGLLSSQLLGLKEVFGNENLWQYLVGMSIALAIIQLVFLPIFPESPRYLLSKGLADKSEQALIELRGSHETVENELRQIELELGNEDSTQKMSLCDLLQSKTLRSALLLGCVMQLSQQLSGINSVFYYSTSIFQSAGLMDSGAKMATVGVGVVMVLMTVVSVPLMERLGRRPLHLNGIGGMFFMAILLTLCLIGSKSFDWLKYFSVIFALLYVMFFAIGPGSVPWILISEIFTLDSRSAAMSLAVFVNWTANLVVGLTFPLIQQILKDFSFIPFIVLLGLFWIYLYKKMPETKNRTVDEISKLIQGKDSGKPQHQTYDSMPEQKTTQA